MTGMEFKGHLTWNISVNFKGFEVASYEEISLHAIGMNLFMTFKLKATEGRMGLFVDDCSCKVDDLEVDNESFKMLASFGV